MIWTLLKSGHELLGGDPIAKRCIICCPTSLVSNWESECKKWLQVITPNCTALLLQHVQACEAVIYIRCHDVRRCLLTCLPRAATDRALSVFYFGAKHGCTHLARRRCRILRSACALQGRLKCIALCEASRDDVIASLKLFLSASNQCPVRSASGC